MENKFNYDNSGDLTLLDRGVGAIGKSLVKDAVSTGYAFNAGLNIGTGRLGGGFDTRALRSSGKLGLIGAGVGAASTMFSEGTINPLVGAGVGGAVGALGVPAIGAVSGFIGNSVVGAVTSDMAASLPGAMAKGIGAASPVALGAVATVGARTANRFYNVGSKLIRFDSAAENLSQIKFTNPRSGFKAARRARLDATYKSTDSALKRFGSQSLALKDGVVGSLVNGVTVMGGFAAAEGVAGAWNKYEKAKMGTNMGVVGMTPRVPAYSQNASATGDLVFALNKNRRG